MSNIPKHVMPVPLYRYRVMFSDGECIEVIAPKDSSTMRDFALQTYSRDYTGPLLLIAGVADLGKVTDPLPTSVDHLQEVPSD